MGGVANQQEPVADGQMFETYPVLAMIALHWTRPESGRLPKYNPRHKENFSMGGWRHLCRLASHAFSERGFVKAA